MSNKLQTVSFHNQKITVLNHDNKPYIEMRSIVENIGLDWGAQLKRIKRNNILNSTMVIMTTVAKDGKNRELICLPLGYLNDWLFGIDTNRAKEEIRPTLEQYQLECFDVLYNHFMPKVAQQFPNTITTEQQQAIKQAVNERAYRTGEHHQSVYHKLYEHFKIPRYQDLPSRKFDAAIKFLGGVTHNSKLSDEDLYDLAWLLKAADRMRYQIELITPALQGIGSSFHGSFYSMASEYRRTIKFAKVILERETAHISDKGLTNKWNNVLSVIRNKPKSRVINFEADIAYLD